MSAEGVRQEVGEIGAAQRHRLRAVERVALEQEVLPQPVDQAAQALGRGGGVQRRPGIAGQFADHLERGIEQNLVRPAADADIVVPRSGLAPERVPHGDLRRVRQLRIEARVDQLEQGRRRVRAVRRNDLVARLGIFVRHMAQRGGQQLLLGVEVKVDHAGRQPGPARHRIQRDVGQALLIDPVDGRLNQLFPAGVLRLPRHRLAGGRIEHWAPFPSAESVIE